MVPSMFYVKLAQPIDGHQYFCHENFSEIHLFAVKQQEGWYPERYWLEYDYKNVSKVLTTSQGASWIYRRCSPKQLKNFVFVKLSAVRL
jgi:hypothetical protein